jgi:hypothetical protein
MADLKQKVEIVVSKSGTGAKEVTAEMRDLAAVAKSTTSAFAGLGTAFLGAFGGETIINFAKQSFKAFLESEEAANRLAGTLRARGQYTKEYAANLQELAESLRDVTTHGDEAILGVETQLVAFGASREQMEELTKSVLDLSAGLRIDLATAANMVGKALGGETSVFSRYGFKINEAASEGQKLNSVLAQIQERFGGLAENEGNTLAGQMRQMAEAWGDIQESIGQLIAQRLGPAIKELGVLVKSISSATGGPAGSTADVPVGYTPQMAMAEVVEVENKLRAELKIETSLERQKQIRKAIHDLIEIQKDKPNSDTLDRLKNIGANIATGNPVGAGLAGIAVSQREINQIETVLGAKDVLANRQKPVSAAPVSAEQTKALQELGKLEATLQTNRLEGFEKERAAIEVNFQTRQASIERLAELGRIEDDQRHRLIVANEAVREQETAMVDLREVEKTQAEQVAAFKERQAELAQAEQLRHQQASQEIADFERELNITAITSGQTRIHLAISEFEKRIAFYQQLRNEGRITEEELVRLRKDANAEMRKADAEYMATQMKKSKELQQQYKQLGEAIQVNLAGGLARATVQGIGNFKDLGRAFQQFASDFLKQVAEMILQMLILNAIKAAGRSFGFGLAAQGGVFPRMMASGGVAGAFDVSSPTYFPNQNVVAGEAGRETLAVLSRPRTTSFRGVPAVSGSAAGNDVSLVSTAGLGALAGGSGGGTIKIDIMLDQGLRAQIANEAAGQAVVRVDQRLSEDSQTSRAVRQLSRA